LIIRQVHIAGVAICGISECQFVTVPETYSIRPVRVSCPESLLVTQLYCLPQIIRGEVVDHEIPAAAKVPVPRRRVKVETRNKHSAVPVLPQPLEVFLVKAQPPKTSPASQLTFSLLSDPFAIGVASAKFLDPALPVSIDLLLLTRRLRLSLLWRAPSVPLILLLLDLLLSLSLLLCSLLLALGAPLLSLSLLSLLSLLGLLLTPLLPHLLPLGLLGLLLLSRPLASLSLLSLPGLVTLLLHLLPLRLLDLLLSSLLLPVLTLLLPLLFLGLFLLLAAVLLNSGQHSSPCQQNDAHNQRRRSSKKHTC